MTTAEQQSLAQPDALLSVIMPVYNGEKYLAEAIESVLAQTYPHFELFVVDDASTDTTSHIIARYASRDPRIIHLTNERNAKQSEVRNRPIKQARGVYVALVDSDDICHSDRFEKQVHFLRNNQHIDVVGSSYSSFIDEAADECKAIVSAQVGDVHHGCPPVHNPTCMMKRSVFTRHGFYNSHFDNAEDVELWFRWFSQGVRFANLPEVLYKKRIHQNSVSISKIKSQVYLLLKINMIAIAKYRIRFSLKGYLRTMEQFLYLFYLTLRLDQVYARNRIGYATDEEG